MLKNTSCLFIVFMLVLFFQFLFSQNTRSNELFLNDYTQNQPMVEFLNRPITDKREVKTVTESELREKVDSAIKNEEKAVLKNKAVPEMSLALR